MALRRLNRRYGLCVDAWRRHGILHRAGISLPSGSRRYFRYGRGRYSGNEFHGLAWQSSSGPTCRKRTFPCARRIAASAQQRFNSPAFGAEVFTTAGSREKCDACEALGAVWRLTTRKTGSPSCGRRPRNKVSTSSSIWLQLHAEEYRQPELGRPVIDHRLLTGAKAELMLARFMVKRQTMTASTLRHSLTPQKQRSQRNCAKRSGRYLFPAKPIIDRFCHSKPRKPTSGWNRVLYRQNNSTNRPNLI